MPLMITFESIGPGFLARSFYHQHDTWEISVYTAGRGVAYAGEQPIPFQKGTIVFWPPNIPHREKSERGYTEFWILTKGGDKGLDHSRAQVFHDTPNGTFGKITSALHEEYQLRQSSTDAVVQDLFGLLLRYLESWQGREAKHPLVEELTNLLITHRHDPELEVSNLMKTLPMSIGHLRKHFERTMGKTPIQFLIDLRINEAKLLLRRGFSVKEAGNQVGYPDPYYFSRIFFKATGARPSAYRMA
jgi:AraC-like DNA-binding protein